jgi:hypothetical protein
MRTHYKNLFMTLSIAIILGTTSIVARSQEEAPIPHITIRHLSTVFVNRGICSIRFGIDSQPGEEAEDIEIQMKFVNKTGKTIYRATIHTSRDGAIAGRYSEEFVEGEGICFDSSTQVVIAKAIAKFNGEMYDLIKLKRITEDNFIPYTIRIGR